MAVNYLLRHGGNDAPREDEGTPENSVGERFRPERVLHEAVLKTCICRDKVIPGFQTTVSNGLMFPLEGSPNSELARSLPNNFAAFFTPAGDTGLSAPVHAPKERPLLYPRLPYDSSTPV